LAACLSSASLFFNPRKRKIKKGVAATQQGSVSLFFNPRKIKKGVAAPFGRLPFRQRQEGINKLT
jgi:hypothetical protein